MKSNAHPALAYLFSTLVLHLSLQHAPLLVFASFVLEPDADDTRAQARQLHQLFLHRSVWSWVSVVARAQHVQLRLAECRPHTCSLLRLDGLNGPARVTFSA